jgi:hypothetical protein
VSAAVAIGWRGLSATTQDRLVRDAWLLMAWWIVVGLACSGLLLEVFGVRSPALRYPLTALVMYGVGTVLGMRIWLAAFSRAVRSQPGRFGTAPEPPPVAARFRRGRGVVVAPDPGTVVAVIGVAIEIAIYFESGATLFWLTLIAITATAAIMAAVVWLVGMDRLMSDSESVILANLAHEFVFDLATERGILPHRSPGESLPTILRETRGRGLTFLVFSAVGGVTLMLMLPGAASLADIFG